MQKLWGKGVLSRLLGGVLNLLNASIGLVVFTLVLLAYPIFDWLAQVVAGSSVLARLVELFSFVPTMLPEVFRHVTMMGSAV